MSEQEEIGPESVEAGLRAVFSARAPNASESIIDVVERQTGVRPSVMLRDLAEASPVLRVVAEGAGEATSDGRYQMLGEIAHGGVGVVFKSRDRDLGRDVAIKVLRKEFAGSADVLERFVEEAQIGGQLQHPGVVPVYGIGIQPDGRPFFAMKLIKGRTLSAFLSERQNPAEKRRRFLGIFEQVCQTIAYAHARGVIHRDLKPSNVMIGAFGEVHVVDWGFAKVLGSESKGRARPGQTIVATVRSGEGSSHSMAGSVLGTPAYMPPEQALGQIDDLDERADVFCLGGILCEILTGKPPYVGDATDLFSMAAGGSLEGAYKRLDACGADPDLIGFAKSCLASAPAERPRDAAAVARSISQQLAAAEERARRTELEAAEARAQAHEQQAHLAEEELAAKRAEARAVEEERAAAEERSRQQEEQRRVAWERKARVRTLAIAAALILALLGGGGGYLVISAERHERESTARAAVNAALHEASERQGQGDWDEALAAARRAKDLAASADDASRDRAAAALASIGSRKQQADVDAARAKRDSDFLDRLEEISLQSADDWDLKRRDAEHEEAFRKIGCDVTTLSVEEAVAQLRDTTDPVRMATVLDWWAITRMNLSEEGGRRLAEIASGIDPDPVRSRIRQAVVSEDRDTLLREAATVDVHTVPVKTLTLLGRGLLGLDEITALRELMHRVHRAHPDDFWANAWLAHAYAFVPAPDTAKAMPYFAAGLALQPQRDGMRLHLAYCLAQYGQFEEALALGDQALAANPDSLMAHRSRTSVLLAMRDFERAEVHAKAALRIDPESQQAWGGMMDLAFWRGDAHGALEAGEQMLRHASSKLDRAKIYTNMSGARLLLADPVGAIEDVRRALELRPDQSAHANLGEALRVLGRIDEAIAEFHAGLERFPDSTWLHLRLAQLHLQAQQWSDAWEHIQRLRELDRILGVQMLSAWHHHRHEIPQGIRYAREAIRLMPTHPSPWNDLALLHLRVGDYASAITYLDRYRELETSYPMVSLGNRAEIHLQMGEPAKAIELLEGHLDPKDVFHVHPYSAYGQALLWCGRYEEAREALKTGRALEASLPRASMAYIGLDELANLLRDAERICSVAGRGDAGGEGAEEVLARATMHFYRLEHGRAAELFDKAFAAEPSLAANAHDRFHATCAAAMAGPAWSPKALVWLRMSLGALQETVAKGDETDAVEARWVLGDWRLSRFLKPVHDTVALARMPDKERTAWLEFWADVEALDASTRKEMR